MNGTLIVVWLASTWVGQAPPAGCAKDTDCKGDRICVAGQCQAPSGAASRAEPSGGASSAPSRGALGDVADSMVGLNVDVGGLLFYGPSIDLEVGTRFAVYAEVRAIGFGLVRWAIAGETNGEHNSVGATDYGLGAGFRYYFGNKANRQGLYVGGLVEYISTDSIANSEDPKYIYHTVDLLLGATVGYRWVFKSGMTLGAGGAVGFVKVLEASSYLEGSGAPLPSGYRNDAADGVGGLLTLEVGYAF